MQLGLWSRVPLSVKLLAPEPWREKINTKYQSFGCTTRRSRQQIVGEGWVLHWNIFKVEKQERQITMYFHKVTLNVPATPASPSPPLPLPLCHPWESKNGGRSSFSSSSTSSVRRQQEWRLYDDPLPLNVVNNHPVIQLRNTPVCLCLCASSYESLTPWEEL